MSKKPISLVQNEMGNTTYSVHHLSNKPVASGMTPSPGISVVTDRISAAGEELFEDKKCSPHVFVN